MAVLFAVLWPLERTLDVLLALGRWLAMAALAVMVALILGQVFFRYILNDAPSWTEEGARFGMLWLTGLMAPLAYRQGGFVAIDMLGQALAPRLSQLLGLLLLGIALWVLIICVDRGLNNHVFSLAGRGDSPSLRVPLGIFGGENIRFLNSWAYASLATGFVLLLLVNVELMLRQIIIILGGGGRLKPLGSGDLTRAD